VWRRVTSVTGFRDEFAPWFRVGIPRGVESLTTATAPLGRPLGRVWVLLLGFIPVDYDDITLVSLDPGLGFHECSPMLTQREWVHKRRLEPTDSATVLTDDISFVPRRGVPGSLYRAVTVRIFRHRHRRLQRWFGGELLGAAYTQTIGEQPG